MTWLKSTTGMVVAVFVVILIILGIWKGQSIWDHYLGKRYNDKTQSSIAHGDTAKVELRAADSAHASGVVVHREFATLTNSPEVQRNPVAVRVAVAGKKVIAVDSTEIKHLRGANAQLESQVHELETRGEKPVPRITPYADLLYSKSLTTNRSVPVARAGVDYRVAAFANVKLEASYEPPPMPKPGTSADRPEIRISAGVHIVFR